MMRTARWQCGGWLLGIVAVVLGTAPPCPAQDAEAVTAFRTSYLAWRDQQTKGNYREAVRAAEECAKAVGPLFGADHPHTARTLVELGELHILVNNFVRAETHLRQALKIREAKLGADHADAAEPLYHLARLYETNRDIPKAAAHIERCVKIRFAKLGEDSAETARAVQLQGAINRWQGKRKDAVELGRAALETLQKKLPANHLWIAEAAAELSRAEYDLQEPGPAGEHLDLALAILTETLGDEHPATIPARLSQIFRLVNAGNVEQAEQGANELLKLCETKLGPSHLWTAFALHRLAAVALRRSQFPEALAFAQRSQKIRATKLGEDNLENIFSLRMLRDCYRSLKQFDKALELDEKIAAFYKSKFGEGHPETAISQTELGMTQMLTGKLDTGPKQMLDGLEKLRKISGEDSPDVAELQVMVGTTLLQFGQAKAAEELYKKSLSALEAAQGSESQAVLSTKANLAVIYESTRRPAEARKLYEECVQVTERTLGPHDPSLARNLSNLSNVQSFMEQWPEAIRNKDRDRHIYRRYMATILPGLSESEQLRFLKTQTFSLNVGLGFAYLNKKDATLPELTAAWLLNGKALANETLAQQSLATRQSGNPEVNRLNNQLGVIRRQLSQAVMNPPKRDQIEDRLKQIETLNQQREELSKKVAVLLGKQEDADPWLDLSAVRAGIPQNAVLLEFMRVTLARTNPRETSREHYFAWLIPAAGAGNVQFFDLGSAAEIDAAILVTHRNLRLSLGLLKDKGEEAAEATVKAPLAFLGKKLLQPLASQLTNVQHLIICPDAGLWLLPWSAVIADGDKYLIEQKAVTMVVTGRDLARRDAATIKPTRPVIVANPNYDLGLPKDTPLEKKPFRALPGSAMEARAVAPQLSQIGGIEPFVLVENNALESKVRNLENPQILMLSTHGFFFGGSFISSALDNPLVRCGLGFTGANDKQRAKRNPDDGILTGIEVLGMKLQGTQLVYLSACQTGLGDIAEGEGVLGLRQAFHLAGARNVLATLWPIADKETVDFTDAFFKSYAKYRDESAALRDAQVSVIETRRKKHKGAHPFFWAAFTLTSGDAGRHLPPSASGE